MGRLTEALYGYRGRPSFLDNAPRYSSTSGQAAAGGSDSDYVKVSGTEQAQQMFEHLLTNEPNFDKTFRTYLKKVLREARNNLSKDAKSYIENDPRKAARAVKYTVYKKLFGGNISILQKRKAGAKYEYKPPRKLQAGQRGGNRRPIGENTRTKQMSQYFGADRGFVLRFLNAGTVKRQTRFGNRGSIRQTDWFAHTSSWQMEAAAASLAEAINGYIKSKANG
jgi:hypothetical protein